MSASKRDGVSCSRCDRSATAGGRSCPYCHFRRALAANLAERDLASLSKTSTLSETTPESWFPSWANTLWSKG
jgi:hypothetical protein